MADDAGNSTSWWQWIGNTAAGLYTANLGAKVQIAQDKATLAAAEQNETLSFLGYNLHKKTLLWIAGGAIITVLLLAVVKRR